MFEKLKRKLRGDGRGSKGVSAAAAPSSSKKRDQESAAAVHPVVTEARLQLEREIKKSGMQKPGESMADAVERVQREFTDHYLDFEPEVNIRNPQDRITDLIFHGKSDKPKTDASSPNATASDRMQASIESALENLWLPQPRPTHQIIKLDPTDLDRYVYSPLGEPRSIRLLHFHQDEYELPDYRQQKVYTIESFPHAQAPPYLTLSYAWKAPRNDEECLKAYEGDGKWVIIRDGEKHYRLEVGRNLHEGLQKITQAQSSVRYIWIDALCINQKDLRERASQVSMMGDIYSRCTRVVIWLGEMEAREAARIHILHSVILPELIKYIGQHGMDSIKTGNWTKQDLDDRFGVAGLVRSENWNGYLRLYRNTRWFGRAWVIQEVALAPDAVVMFAHLQLAWTDMLLMARFLRASGLCNDVFDPTDADDSDMLTPGTILEAVHELQQSARTLKNHDGLQIAATDLRRRNASRMSWEVFLRCVFVLRAVQSEDPRDRIFAALGFLHIDEGNSGVILPDYQISTEELFIKVTTVLLSKRPGLEILTMRGNSNRRMGDLPTWVPDFTTAPEIPLHQELDEASSRVESWPSWRVEDSKLVLQGVAFTTVKAVHPWDFINDATSAREIAGLDTSVKILMGGFNAVRHLSGSPDPLQILWRTLIADQTSVSGQAPIDSSHFRSFMAQTILQLFDHMAADDPSNNAAWAPEGIGHMFPPSDSKPSASMLKDLQARRNRVKTSLYPKDEDLAVLDTLAKKAGVFVTATGKYTTDRQLYVTEEGLVGLGPLSMNEGDRIVYVRGTPFLFAMREKERGNGNGNEYEMLGETYVHMLANGELAEIGMGDRAGDIVVC